MGAVPSLVVVGVKVCALQLLAASGVPEIDRAAGAAGTMMKLPRWTAAWM